MAAGLVDPLRESTHNCACAYLGSVASTHADDLNRESDLIISRGTPSLT